MSMETCDILIIVVSVALVAILGIAIVNCISPSLGHNILIVNTTLSSINPEQGSFVDSQGHGYYCGGNFACGMLLYSADTNDVTDVYRIQYFCNSKNERTVMSISDVTPPPPTPAPTPDIYQCQNISGVCQ